VSDRQQKAHERKEKLAQEINQWSIKNDKLQFELVSLKKNCMLYKRAHFGIDPSPFALFPLFLMLLGFQN